MNLAGLVCIILAVLHTPTKRPAVNCIPCRPYEVAHDAPLNATEQLLPNTDNGDGHTLARVEFNGIKGDRVPGLLYLPKSPGRHPAVLLQPGYTCNKDADYIVLVARYLADRGLVILTIDGPAGGERKRPGQFTRLIALTQRWHFVQSMGDYSRAIDYLRTRPEVDGERLIFVGACWGAINGITFVAHEPRIKAMVSIVAAGDFFQFWPGSIASSENPTLRLDPIYHVGLIAPRPLLFVNTSHDHLIPDYFAESLHRAAGKGSKVLWVNTDHEFTQADRERVCDECTRFIFTSLGDGATLSAVLRDGDMPAPRVQN